MSLDWIERLGIVAPSNCRNCGAPPRGDRCEYCGSWLNPHAQLLAWAERETGAVTERFGCDSVWKHGLTWTPTRGQKMSV